MENEILILWHITLTENKQIKKKQRWCGKRNIYPDLTDAPYCRGKRRGTRKKITFSTKILISKVYLTETFPFTTSCGIRLKESNDRLTVELADDRTVCLHDTTQSVIYYPQMTDTPSAGCITPPFTGLFFSFLPFFFFLSFYAVKEVTHILLTFYQVFRIVTSHPGSSRQSFTMSSRSHGVLEADLAWTSDLSARWWRRV